VCVQSCLISFVLLIWLLASPTERFFTQSAGLYTGGDVDTFHARHPSYPHCKPTMPIAIHFLISSPIRSGLPFSKLVQLALRPQTSISLYWVGIVHALTSDHHICPSWFGFVLFTDVLFCKKDAQQKVFEGELMHRTGLSGRG
jgi:hypothetical protein